MERSENREEGDYQEILGQLVEILLEDKSHGQNAGNAMDRKSESLNRFAEVLTSEGVMYLNTLTGYSLGDPEKLQKLPQIVSSDPDFN